jgi:hypothetical protein
MTEATSWQAGNERYLRAALAWLRARLERLAGASSAPHELALAPEPSERSKATAPERPASDATPEPTPGDAGPPSRGFWGRLRAKKPSGQAPELAPGPEPRERARALPPPAAPEAVDDIAQLRAAMDAAAQLDPPPALVQLGRRLGLSRFGQEVLLLCAAMELDTRTASLCARAQDDPSRAHPTFALALVLFDEPALDVLSPEQPLRYWRLLEIHQAPGQPLTVSPLRADERILSYLVGFPHLDDRLTPLLLPLEPDGADTALPASQQAAVDDILAQLGQAPAGGSVPVVQLLGSDAPSKQLIAAHAAAVLGLTTWRLPAGLLPAGPPELETLIRLWQRESLLMPVALYLDALSSELDAPQAGAASPIARFLARGGGLTFLDTREVWPAIGNSLLIDTSRPLPDEQEAAWAAALGDAAGASPAALAAQFHLGLAAIRDIARRALATPSAGDAAAGPPAPPSPESIQHRLWDACLARTQPRLDMLAQRITPRVTWDDIVLPEPERALVMQIAAQVGQRSTVYRSWGFGDKMSRGLGISALFAGESGTGKTMAAEVIANQLRLNLYRIDLSAVVSKYIGETEKNLRRLFDAAEDGGTILFFDEADALFGKRSEVKDSHDRYANIEINYLLQRMEAYRGLAILATNMKSAVDPAFLRRLRFIVNFPFPRAAERLAIWQKVFPARTPTAGLDFARLAALNLTGANIHSIALHAAFLAAQAGAPVTLSLVLDAARTELRKLGRVINELEFRLPATGAVA